MVSPAPWLAGLDCGQVHDPAALAIAERKYVEWGNSRLTSYAVRYLHRFPLGTPYLGLCLHERPTERPCRRCPGGVSLGGIVEHTLAVLAKLPLPRHWEVDVNNRPYRFLFDMTGVGRGVYDAFKAQGVWPIAVTMTHGYHQVQHDHLTYTVPKRRLVSDLVVTMQEGRLKVAAGLEHAATLAQEAKDFQYKISTSTVNDSYGAWRQGTFDDLLFAVGLVIWWGENHRPPVQLARTATTAQGPAEPLERLRGPLRPVVLNPHVLGGVR